MNPKDYKKIAEIIKGSHLRGNCEARLIATRLADYFKKESFKNGKTKFDLKMELKPEDIFDKKQFLKDSGVQE